MKIQYIAPEYVPQVLPAVRSFIASGLAHTDSCTEQHAEAFLCAGQWVLLIAVADTGEAIGAYVLSFSNSPGKRSAMIVSAAGKGLASNEAKDQVSAIARSMGATHLQALARPSAARLYKRVGLVEKASLMEMKL